MTAGQRAMPGDRRAEAQTPSIAVWARLPSCMLLILLLSSGLRFYNLGTQSFWNDEGNTARLVERPIRLIIEGAAGDIHPPGYYLLLHTWRAAVGDSEYALRAFSALCGVLTVAVAAAASRAAIGQRGHRLTIWATATLVAVHPLAVAYSQEARMYAQLGLASALTLWAALVLVRRDARATRRRHLLATLALAAGVGLGLYTQYAYALALVGLNLAFSLYWLTARPWRWPLLSRWVVGHVLGGLLFAPWAPIALGARGWQPPDLATGEAFRALTRTLLVGTTLPEGIAPIVLACACLVGLWTLVISLHARPGSATRFAAWASLCMALVPLALITAAGLYRPAYLKFLMVSVAPL
ncbi:MAG: glycosyltransferase family 39 protein, partial [Anaerolineae bacterium]|nr:glycosyltransferase family 39 protein [Anaerolineae bacterium]